jgi:aryl-alcohol dehydrogenase-like predicted oxidoreductase
VTSKTLGATGLLVHPLCLGGNVFGWTADEAQSFAVLDAYVAAGGNFIDTSDMYSVWVPGHDGGESERILGRWMASRQNRDRLVLATKVGMNPTRPGLSAANIEAAAEGSLRRLGVDHVDLYYAHRDDERTPLRETLRAFEALRQSGKVRHVAASNYGVRRLLDARTAARREGTRAYDVLQPHYNLMDRGDYEGPLMDLCVKEEVASIPYFGLARGFLTGKYRRSRHVESARREAASAYLDERGERVLSRLDEIATAHETTVAAVALAWLAGRPTARPNSWASCFQWRRCVSSPRRSTR